MTIQEAMDRLRERTTVPMFAVEPWDPNLHAELRRTSPEELFGGQQVRDPKMAACAVAGLHLWNDDFSGSHNLCQGIDTQTGAYWHGLCHRREGHEGAGIASNLGNARYWFRQVGPHPAFELVYGSALNVLDNAGTGFRWATEAANTLRANRKWDPFAMIDWFVQADAQTISTQSQALLEEIQWREMDLLADWCVQQAVGG
jgi:hypothetical protein